MSVLCKVLEGLKRLGEKAVIHSLSKLPSLSIKPIIYIHEGKKANNNKTLFKIAISKVLSEFNYPFRFTSCLNILTANHSSISRTEKQKRASDEEWV